MRYFLYFFILLATGGVLAQPQTAVPKTADAGQYVLRARQLKEDGKVDKALPYLIKAEKIYRQRQFRDSLVYVNTALAEAFRYQTLSAEAQRYIGIAASFANEKTTPKDILGFFYNRWAAIENMFGSRQKALELSERVVALQDQISDKQIVVYSYNEIAALQEAKYGERGPKKALPYYQKALALAELHQLPVPQMDILINLGRAYDRLAQYDQEIACYQKGLVIAQQLQSDYHQFTLHFCLSTPYSRKRDMAQAYNHLMAAFVLREKLNDKEKTSALSEIEKKYNVGKKENELRIKNIEIENNNKHFAYGLVILGLMVVASVTLVYFYRKSRITNRRLAKLSAENAFLLSEANHRINNNLQLIIVLLSDELRKLSPEQSEKIRILPKIESIAYLHRHLYQSQDKSNLELKDYLEEIRVNFADVFTQHQIQADFDIQPHTTTTDKAMYLGLILTELLINSIKYAFGGQSDKKISFHCGPTPNGFVFSYQDNGQNARGAEIKPKLVGKLCRQIKVAFLIDTSQGFSFQFKTDNL